MKHKFNVTFVAAPVPLSSCQSVLCPLRSLVTTTSPHCLAAALEPLLEAATPTIADIKEQITLLLRHSHGT